MFPRPRTGVPGTGDETVSLGDPLGTQRELSLLSLLELSNELNAIRDLYAIADVALFNLMGHFGSSRGALWVLAKDPSPEVVLVRSQGIPTSVARVVGTSWTQWLTRRPGGVSEPVSVDESREVAGIPGLELAGGAGIQLVAPVTARQRFVGLVALGKRVGGSEFSRLDREVLQASLNLLGTAIENADLYNRSIESNRRLRSANDKLKELDHLKSEFFRNMNHELRTPLTIINAYLESLISAEEAGSQRREHLEVVREQTSRLNGMILNLLDYSKLLEGDLDLEPSRGDVGAVLKSYYEERRPGITSDLREFRFTCASDLPHAFFERSRLLQIVDSLMTNAVKFTPRGSTIHLRAEGERLEDEDWVRIDVEDNGPGISSDRIPFIFESFRQGDGSETRTRGGIGLGLAFARQLAERMGGRLDAGSEVGQGATFTLRLPAA